MTDRRKAALASGAAEAMLDIETLGTAVGSAITSIGIALFDRRSKKIIDTLSIHLDVEDVLKYGMTVSGSTLKFWAEQGDPPWKGTTKVVDALLEVRRFLCVNETDEVNDKLLVWGNGAGFDQPLLRDLYERAGIEAPWRWYNERCFRTFKNEHPLGKALEPRFIGRKHDALDDAVHQAKWLINMANADAKVVTVAANNIAEQNREAGAGRSRVRSALIALWAMVFGALVGVGAAHLVSSCADDTAYEPQATMWEA